MKTLSFAGKNLSEFGVWFDSVRKYKKPAKRFTGFDVPARNGTLYQSNKKFDNVIIEYNCYIKDNFATNYNDLVNYLNSFDGYQILENSTDNTVYRMAVFHEEIAPNMEQFLKSGQFTLFFDCMPQEFLKVGDVEQEIISSTQTYTGNPVSINNPSGASAVSSLAVALAPIQEMHGYDSPWVGGAGKNKLPTSTTKTSNGVTFTVNSDGTITADRTASSTNNAEYDFTVPSSLYGNQVVLNGCPSGGADSNTYRMFFLVNGSRKATDYGNGVSYTIPASPSSCVVRMNVFKEFNGTATFKPMVRLASVADATYEPYENICPITGHTEVEVGVTNGADTNTYTIDLNGTVYGGTLDVLTGVLTVTDANIASYNGETLPSTWISDRDVYASGTTPTTGAQVVYKLTTPTTVQLTAEQISLLTGTNTISSDGNMSIDVTKLVELVNPSYMASKPIFKFQGIGKVMMNGSTVITIPNPVRITVSDPVIVSGVTFTFSNVVDINGLASADIEYLVGHLYLTVGTYTLNATVTGSGTVNCKCDGSTFTGDKTIVVTETGWIPIYAVIANGTTINATMTLTLTMDDIIVDCERMDSYFVSGGQANEIVKLTDGFIEIPKGTTTLSADGTVTVKPKWWRL